VCVVPYIPFSLTSYSCDDLPACVCSICHFHSLHTAAADIVEADVSEVSDGCWSVCAAGQPGMAGSSQVTVPSPRVPSAGGAGGSSGGGGGPVSVGSATVEQIAVTLLRLQQDMNNVLVRLQGLESLTQQQANIPLSLMHFVFVFR